MDTTYLEEQIAAIEKSMENRAREIDRLKANQDADKKALKAYKESLERLKEANPEK